MYSVGVVQSTTHYRGEQRKTDRGAPQISTFGSIPGAAGRDRLECHPPGDVVDQRSQRSVITLEDSAVIGQLGGRQTRKHRHRQMVMSMQVAHFDARSRF
jgi:hypothetical protein